MTKLCTLKLYLPQICQIFFTKIVVTPTSSIFSPLINYSYAVYIASLFSKLGEAKPCSFMLVSTNTKTALNSLCLSQEKARKEASNPWDAKSKLK